MQTYHDVEGAYPEINKWRKQLESVSSFDSLLLKDAWGNEIIYTLREDDGISQIYLYSYGKNGQDEQMSGDDIVVLPDSSISTERERRESNER